MAEVAPPPRVPLCANCFGKCRWAEDPWWYCPRCGDEWCVDHHPMFAPPGQLVRGRLRLDGLSGRTGDVVVVVGGTTTRWRVYNQGPDSIRLAGRNRYLAPGAVALVPLTAVTFELEQ